ncbi:hypothetical protein RUND412_005485 [Rhizina undulata]
MAKRVKFSPHVLRQLAILSICRFAEPVSMTSVYPYLYWMIKSFGVPVEDISFYVGITGASFSFSQMFTGILLGRLSDRVGRRPVILCGLFGTLVTLLMFGFSTTLWMAIAARCLSGLVNGNVGILRTMVAEMVPQKELQPRAFSIMPLIWSIGGCLGPIIGGSLADPLTNHPGWFGGKRPAFFVKFPFALPNLVNALLFIFGLGIGILFMQETLETKKDKPDAGILLGRRIVAYFRRPSHKSMADVPAPPSETQSLLPSASSSYSTNTAPTSDEETTSRTPIPAKKDDSPPIRSAFTFQSTTNIVYYGLLALHSVAFDQLLPVFMSYPRQEQSDVRLPLGFAGGMGMGVSKVGWFFSCYGIVGMCLQFFIFPPVAAHFGSLSCLRFNAFSFPIVYALLPFVTLLSPEKQEMALFAVMFWKCIAVIFAFPCSTILLTNSSPSLRVLGTLNGIAVAVAALGRAIGPAIGGVTFKMGQQMGTGVVPWWIFAVIAFLGALPTLLLEEGEGFASPKEAEEEEEDVGKSGVGKQRSS